MRILCIEDEVSVANRIVRLTKEILGNDLSSIKQFDTLDDADDYLQQTPTDILLLDLNLHGADGFDLLSQTLSRSFHTIIISANTDRAIEAFQLGVIDFIPKPFSKERLEEAFSRVLGTARSGQMKYISVKKRDELIRIPIKDILYIKGADNYSELFFADQSSVLHDKALSKLTQLLPSNFVRTHKSYIARLDLAKSIKTLTGPKYMLLYDNESKIEVPISRSKLDEIRLRFDGSYKE